MDDLNVLFFFRFKGNLHICLLQITGYSSLYVSVEDLRKEPFSSENPEHEAMLLKVRTPSPASKHQRDAAAIILPAKKVAAD